MNPWEWIAGTAGALVVGFACLTAGVNAGESIAAVIHQRTSQCDGVTVAEILRRLDVERDAARRAAMKAPLQPERNEAKGRDERGERIPPTTVPTR